MKTGAKNSCRQATVNIILMSEEISVHTQQTSSERITHRNIWNLMRSHDKKNIQYLSTLNLMLEHLKPWEPTKMCVSFRFM